MPVPASINELSTVASINSPAGSESPITADDYLRTHAAFIAQLRDANGEIRGAEGVTLIVNATDKRKLADPAQGPGLIAYSPSQTYPANSVGSAIKALASAGEGGNLLEKIMESAEIRGMYVRNSSASSISVGIGMSKILNSVVEYRFQYNGDGLLLLRGVYSGVEDESTKRPAITTTGTFVTTPAPSSYTESVGAKFTATFTGSHLSFRSRVDDRGGLWKISLSNGMTRNVSTWASVLNSNYEQVIFDKLEHGTYTVVFEFMGADPMNAPSTAPARGWLRYTPASTTELPLNVMKVGRINTTTMKAVVSPDSIPDFAISARPQGAAYSSEWVPHHGTTTGVSYNPAIKVLVDGQEVVSTPSGMPAEAYNYREIEGFQIIQQFEARNPNGTGGSMWRHYVVHSLRRRDPALNIKNRLEVLQNTRMSQIYFGMLPAATANVQRLVLNNGYELNGIPSDNSDYTFDWGATSAMYAGEFAPGNFHAAAVFVTSLKDTAGLGSPYAQTVPGRINHRSDGVTKVYWGAGENVDVPTGTVMRSEHRIGVISGARYPDELLKSI